MRLCDVCARPYSRRNMMELWVVRNPGHVTGWVKTKVRVCLKCQTAAQTQRVVMVARVAIGPRGGVTSLKARGRGSS